MFVTEFMHLGSSTSSWGKYALDLLDYTMFSSGGFWFLLGIVTTLVSRVVNALHRKHQALFIIAHNIISYGQPDAVIH